MNAFGRISFLVGGLASVAIFFMLDFDRTPVWVLRLFAIGAFVCMVVYFVLQAQVFRQHVSQRNEERKALHRDQRE